MAVQDNEDDIDLFRQTMASHGVRKKDLHAGRITPEQQNRDRREASVRTPGTRQPSYTENRSASPPLPSAAIDQTAPGKPLLFVRSGADKNAIRKLKRSDYILDETIDLHGMRELEAERALNQFLNEAKRFDWHHIQIIHGKGLNSDQPGGVLRPLTVHWLKLQPEVIAFCSATIADGGTGATNVLLRMG